MKLDQKRCPLCAGDNQCVIAQSNEAGNIENCWCYQSSIDPETLRKIPEQARGKSCVCPGCAGKSQRLLTMENKLNNRQLRILKGKAQLLEPILKVGKSGVTEAFLKGADEALRQHELIKIKFDDFKKEKKVLAPEIAEKTTSTLVTTVGNVVVLFRRNRNPAEQKIDLGADQT
jgi:RNA-binding protein